MKKNSIRQCIIRGIAGCLNQVLRRITKVSVKSLKPRRDFSQVIGSISSKEAKTIEEEIKVQGQIDKELWK